MNTRSRARLVVLLAAILAIAPAIAKPAADSSLPEPLEGPWQAVAASGPVEARTAVTETAVWTEVSRGDRLMPKTLVQTGKKGRATLTRNASVLMLDPHSRVELPGEGFSEMETSVIQTEGSVLYKVDSRSNPHFEVVTPYLVAGVKGTSFLVTVNDRYASVTVRHGLVEITNPGTGEKVELGPGQSVVRERDEIEMDFARDRSRSREAKRESKRLDRMDRRAEDKEAKHKLATADNVDLAGAASEERTDDTRIALDDAETDDDLSWMNEVESTEGGLLDSDTQLEDDIANELIEEMIREEIKHGTIHPPDDDVVPLPPIQQQP